MAEDPEVKARIAEIQEDIINGQSLVRSPEITEIKKPPNKNAVADAYLAGYEIGYKDGKADVQPDPEKDGMIIEPMRLVLPWWP